MRRSSFASEKSRDRIPLCRQALPGRVLRGEHSMIEQLQFSLRTAETPRLPSAWAYRIYGWLMAQLPADTAARLHEQGEHPLSQSLCFDAAAQTSVWTLNLLDEALAAQVRPLLAVCTSWITTCTPSPIPSRTPASRSVGTRGLNKAMLWLCLRHFMPPPCSNPTAPAACTPVDVPTGWDP